MRPTLALCALFALTAPLAARSAEPPEPPAVETLRSDPGFTQRLHLLETWIDAQRAYERIPGVSMAVVRGDDLLWSRGFGLADREAGTPATPETLYSICSISKLFTAIGVLQLRDDGTVDLDEPLGSYLPWFSIEQSYPEGPPVTLWGLLTHSSGLPRESDFPYWSPPDFPFPTREQIRERLAEQETLYPAATYFQYSNLGLTLAGEVVAAVSGAPYEDYVTERILRPLGLDDTRPELPAELHGGRLAVGYAAPDRSGERARLPLFDARGITPAAGFSSSAEDLARFASWQLRVLDPDAEGHAEAEAVLARNTLREMQRVQWLDPDWETARGLGFGVYRRGDTTYVGHSGSCPGYRSALWLQTGDRMGMVAMANASGVDTELWVRRAHEILAPAIAAAADGPEGDPGRGDEDGSTPPELLRFAGRYNLAPWGGEAAVIPWKGSLAALGLPTGDPLGDLEELRHVDGNRFRRVRGDGEPGEEVVFEEDADGRVTALVQHSSRWARMDLEEE
jgi:CubicO group peptidase (beta-lactamase class C family)